MYSFSLKAGPEDFSVRSLSLSLPSMDVCEKQQLGGSFLVFCR